MRSAGSDSEELTTARLSLRRPEPADVDLIYTVHSDRRACEHNPADLLATRAEAAERYQRWDAHWQRHGFGYWVVCDRRDRTPLGFCGIKLMQLHGREVLNLFYRLAPHAWGNGTAGEAAGEVVRWAREHQPDRPVIARIRPANTASVRVATRTGLHRVPNLDSHGEDGLDWIFTSGWVRHD